jgi:organic hydroperoxide reductase OsmC/OhrA
LARFALFFGQVADLAEHRATVSWKRTGEGDFAKGHYSREHRWRFDGGVEVVASASPGVVPAPWSTAEAVDPEEAFVASISACHMLTFIDIARHKGFAVEAYDDDAVGLLTRNAEGHRWVSAVTLNPRITFTGRQPSPDELADLHHLAHEGCFISNSVRSTVTVARVATTRAGGQT